MEIPVIVVGSGFAGLAFTITYLVDVGRSRDLVVVAPALHDRSTAGQLTPRAVKWFEAMDLEKLLEDNLSRPPVSDLVYVVVDKDGARILGQKKRYLVNPEPGRLLAAMKALVGDVRIIRGRVIDAAVDKHRIILVNDTGSVFYADKVVDASGPSRVVLRSLDMNKPSCLVLGQQLVAETVERIDETFFFYSAEGVFNSVGWIVPKNNLLYLGIVCVAGTECRITRDLVMRYACRVLKAGGYSCPRKIIGARYIYGRAPVSKESFVTVENIGDSLVFAVGEAGGYITARNGEGIPYALWTGTYAARYLDEPEKYRDMVMRDIIEAELLPKIREAREFYKRITGTDVYSQCMRISQTYRKHK